MVSEKSADRKAARTMARDRRMAAIHEAGHVVISRRAGLLVESAWIEPTDNPVWPDEKTWIGHTRLGSSLTKCAPHERRMIGVAGAVAEAVWSGDDVDEEEQWQWREVMSESDWHIVGCAPGDPDEACFAAINQTATLLAGSLRRPLLREARRLIVESRPYG